MNVGIFADCYAPTRNGVATSIVQLKEGLEHKGHKAVVVTVDTPHYDERDATVYRFPSVPFNPNTEIRIGLVTPRSVRRIIQKEHIDVVHTHTEFTIGWAARRAAHPLGLPLVHTAHTMYEDYRHYLCGGKWVSAKMIQKLLGRFLLNYDVLVCPSRKAQNYFKSFMPGIKTVVIGNGICKTRFGPDLLTEEEKDQTRKTLGLQPSDKVILYVGRMAKEKRVLELFHVLIPLLQEQPQCKALFVGSGPSLEAMIRAAERSNLQNQVTFTGTVDWEQIHRLYSIADVFVTASLSEVHPMTLLEASTCGLPIIARRDDSCIDLVEDDCNGYLVDSDRQIATRLSETVNDENRLLAFSKNALFWADRFSAKAHVEKLESLYQQIKGLNHAQDRVHRCR